MSMKFFILLANISTASSPGIYSYSEKYPGAGYSRRLGNLHTVVYNFDNFSGSIVLQGTLAKDPQDNDWIDISDTVTGGDDSTAIGGDSTIVGTRNVSLNFSGNFAWIRCKYYVEQGTIAKVSFGF